MKGRVFSFFKALFVLFAPFLLIPLCFFITKNDAHALTDNQKKFYGQNNIIFIGDCLPGASFETTGTPVTGSVFPATAYPDITDAQIRGLLAVINHENGGSITAVQKVASIMPNLYEFYKPSGERTGSGLTYYIRFGGWFGGAEANGRYDESFTGFTEEEFQAVKSVIKDGNRTLPTQIIEYDDVGDIVYIENDGVKHYSSEHDYIYDQNNYIPGKTIIMGKYGGGSTFVFYDWADPSREKMGQVNAGGKGDVFGYSASNPPSSGTAAIQGNSSGGSSLGTSGTINATTNDSVINYKGDEVLTKEEINKIKEYQAYYEEGVKGTDLPWQVLAALHYRETRLGDTNPGNNDDGIFQIVKNSYTPGQKLDQAAFVAQAKDAAKHFLEAIPSKYSVNSEQGIKYGFFAYNGTASVYVQQALKLGFSQEQAELGDGSPYVMNRFDEKRDPTVEPTKSNNTWGQIKRDYGSIEYPANPDFGAFVVYTALIGGSWTSTGGVSTPIDNCNQGADSGTSGGNGGEMIAATARKLAWPDKNHYNEAYPAFVEAAKALGEGTRGYCPGYRASTGRGWPDSGVGSPELDHAQDCGIFVSTVIRTSGVDPDYPSSYTGSEEYHMSNSELWTEIPNEGNESNLQPGDVFVVNAGSYGYQSKQEPSDSAGASGHIFIYLGGSDITASASLCGRSGNLGESVRYSESYGKYRIFRSTVQSGTTGGSVGSFDEELKALENSTGLKVGAAVSAMGNTEEVNVQVGGSWLSGRAWSTIKVPLAIAATQKNASAGSVTDPYGGTCSHNLSSAIHVAITESDNCGAWWLWEALGGDNSSAAQTVTDIIKSGKDNGTTVTSSPGSIVGLTSGITEWSLVGQAIFAANMSNISGSSSVMAEMKTHNDGHGNYGLNQYTAMTKGGWGPSNGAATRQFGIVKFGSKCSAIAIGVNADSQFDTLTKIATIIGNHQSELPSGTCPAGL